MTPCEPCDPGSRSATCRRPHLSSAARTLMPPSSALGSKLDALYQEAASNALTAAELDTARIFVLSGMVVFPR